MSLGLICAKIKLKSDTRAAAISKNRLLVKDEPYRVINEDGSSDIYFGDGINRFNALPPTARLKTAELDLDAEGLLKKKVWSDAQTAYIYPTVAPTVYQGPVDPGPSGLNIMNEGDTWEEVVTVTAPSALTGSTINNNTGRLNWTDNSADEDGFVISRSDPYDDWALDIAQNQEIVLNQKILKDGALYVCTTAHNSGTPKTFNVGNFSVSFLSFADIHTTAANVTTYDATALEYGKRYTFRVSAKKGELLSINNPTTTVRTTAAASTQTDKILAAANLWSLTLMNDAASPLADASGNNRTFTKQGAASVSYQQSPLVNSGAGQFSVYCAQNDSYFMNSSIWNFSGASWEVGYWMKLHPSLGVPGNGPFFGLWTNGVFPNNTIALWTNSDSTKFQVQTVSSTGSWVGLVGSFVFQKGVVYMLSLRYNHADKKLTLFVNGVQDVEVTKDLGTGFSCDRFGWNRSAGGGLNQYMQKGYVIAGGFLSNQDRLDIYNAGL
jgi:hypothetical protein